MSETVLLVSEDSSAAAEVTRILKEQGYEVQVMSRDEALASDICGLRQICLEERQPTLPSALPLLLQSKVVYDDSAALEHLVKKQARQQSRFVQNAREQSFKARSRR